MQKSVDEFVEKYALACGVPVRYMDLTSEIGELGKEIIKGSDYGKEAYRNTESAEEEMGDCLFSLLALCSEMGLDANKALDGALRKYKARFSVKGAISSGR